MALLEMRAKLAPHQPSLLAAHRLIAELTAHGDIRVAEPEIPTTQTLLGARASEEYDWKYLLARAQEASGYMLTFLPLTDKTPNLNPILLSEAQQQHTVNLRAVIDALRADGGSCQIRITRRHLSIWELRANKVLSTPSHRLDRICTVMQTFSMCSWRLQSSP